MVATEKRYLKPEELVSLEKRGEVFVVCLYDRLAQEGSAPLYIKNIDLAPRVFKNSIGQLDPFEVELYVIGVFNVETLVLQPLDCFLELNDLKHKLKKEIMNETR